MVPRVSIGMPVYNGQRYVADAIDSILAQTFEDFELIISDNGSQDRTESICRRYAAADRRVRYCRGSGNRGAAWNFNRVVRLARGEYFRWAAHDDLCAPTLLGKCVEALDADERVVLCHSRVCLIDADGGEIGEHAVRVPTDSPRPHLRLRGVLADWMCFAIFGLMRRDRLVKTGLLGAYAHADGVLLTRMCLQGPFCQIDEPLFCSRRHGRQSAGVMRDKYMYAAWFDPANAGRVMLPNWRINAEYLKAVVAAPVRLADKMRCLVVVAREALSDRDRLTCDLATAVRMAVGGSTRRSRGVKTSTVEEGGR